MTDTDAAFLALGLASTAACMVGLVGMAYHSRNRDEPGDDLMLIASAVQESRPIDELESAELLAEVKAIWAVSV